VTGSRWPPSPLRNARADLGVPTPLRGVRWRRDKGAGNGLTRLASIKALLYLDP